MYVRSYKERAVSRQDTGQHSAVHEVHVKADNLSLMITCAATDIDIVTHPKLSYTSVRVL